MNSETKRPPVEEDDEFDMINAVESEENQPVEQNTSENNLNSDHNEKTQNHPENEDVNKSLSHNSEDDVNGPGNDSDVHEEKQENPGSDMHAENVHENTSDIDDVNGIEDNQKIVNDFNDTEQQNANPVNESVEQNDHNNQNQSDEFDPNVEEQVQQLEEKVKVLEQEKEELEEEIRSNVDNINRNSARSNEMEEEDVNAQMPDDANALNNTNFQSTDQSTNAMIDEHEQKQYTKVEESNEHKEESDSDDVNGSFVKNEQPVDDHNELSDQPGASAQSSGKKEDQMDEEENSASVQNTSDKDLRANEARTANAMEEERPIKGGSYQIPEDERPIRSTPVEDERPIRFANVEDERPIKSAAVVEDERPIRSATIEDERPLKPSSGNNMDDERPIKSAAPIMEDERPIKSAAAVMEDERPIKSSTFYDPNVERPLTSAKMDIELPQEKEKEVEEKLIDDFKPATSARPKLAARKPFKKPVAKPVEELVPEDEDRPLTGGKGYNIPAEAFAEDRPLASKGTYNFEESTPTSSGLDEKPIRPLKSGFDAEDAGPPEFDPNAGNVVEETGPLDKRIRSKIVKTRQNAFEELAGLIEKADESDSVVEEYASEFLKFIAETNPAAQEKALCAFKAYLDKASSPRIEPKAAVKVLIDKAIGPGKPNIKKVSNDVLCLLFEKLDKVALFEGINESIAAKNQKTACAGVQAVVELLINYGPRKLDFLKPFFGQIEKLAASTVATLRNEAMNFYKETLKWMGEAAKPFMSKLKKQQIDELDKYYEELPKEAMKPLRGEEEAVAVATKGGKGPQMDMGGMDPYDISDPVDIFTKFNEHWCDKVLAQTKWLEKKQMLEDFAKAASVPRLAPTSWVHINTMLKRLLNDSNMNVMLTAIKIYGILAKGLRRNFAGTAKVISPYILQKYREKKTQVIDETHRTFDLFFYSISLEDITEDLKEALADKNSFAKVNLLNLIDKFIEKNAQTPEKCEGFFKNIIGTLKGLLNDGDGSVRSTTMTTLGKMKTILGDRIVGGALNDVDQSKLNKIIDHASKVEVMEEEKGSALNTSINQSRPATTRGPATKRLETSASRPATATNGGMQRAQTSANLKKNGSSKNLTAASGNTAAATSEAEVIGSLTAEDAEAKLIELGLSEAVIKGMDNANWKDRQTALGNFGQWINENTQAISQCPDVVIRFLKTKLKDWKEANLGINKDNFAIISSMCSKQEVILNKRAFFYVCGLLVNNCADVKFSESVYSIILSFTEQVIPKYIINTIINLTQDTKATKSNPKTYAEVCNVLVKLLDDLTVRFFPLKETIDYGKFAIANTNAQCRTAAISLFKSLYAQVGQPISDLINDIPPQTLKTLQGEFTSVVPITDLESKVKVQFRGEVAAEIQNVVETNPLDSLPRADISRESEKILKTLSNSDWKVRKEGLEQLEQLLTSHGNRISPNGLHDLVAALKIRLADPNKALARGFVNFVGRFALALGKDIQRYSKTLITPLISNLSDKQAQIRQDALASLEKIGNEVGQEAVVAAALPLLVQESPEMRTEVINLVLKNADSLPKVDIKSNISAILSALHDRTKEIRSLAEKLLEKCIAVIGINPFQSALKDLKPALQKDLKPVISKYADVEPAVDLDTSINQGRKLDKTAKKIPGASGSVNSILAQSTPQNQQKGMNANSTGSLPPTGHGMSKPSPKKGLTGSGSTSSLLQNAPTSMHGGGGVSHHVPLTPTSMLHKPVLNPNSIITPTGQKEQRMEEEKKNRWPTDELNDELVDQLKIRVRYCLSTDLVSKMFSYDFRKHIEAVTTFKKALVLELPATLDILDLIVRWIFIRLFDNSNTQTLKEILDYVSCLVNTLDAEKYVLLPFEAQVLVPALIERLGTNNSTFRSSLQKLLVKIGMIHPPQNVVVMLLQGLNSKNPKVRVECLDTLTAIAQLYGAQIFNQKDIRFFGKLLTHQDPTIKTAATNLVAELGRSLGETIFQIVTDLPPRVVDMLHSKIQSTPKPIFHEGQEETKDDHDKPEPLYLASPDRSRAASASQPPTSLLNPVLAADVGGPKTNTVLQVQNQQLQSRNDDARAPVKQPEPVRQSLAGQKIDEEVFDRSLQALIHGNSSEKLDALLLIHDLATSDNEENKRFFKSKANPLMQALYIVLNMVFVRPRSEIPMKFVQYFLNMSHKLCSIKPFLRQVSEENLKTFTEEMLTRLLAEDEGKNAENSDNETIVKTLNSTMLRILENANPNDIYSVLFDLLIKYRQFHSYAKILGLIIKCILKLTKCLEQILPTLQPDRILLKSHLYLIEFANESNKVSDDIGIKTIKTILNELVKLYKERIWEFYTAVQNHPTPDTYIQRWITVILRPLSNNNTVSPRPMNTTSPMISISERKALTPTHQMMANPNPTFSYNPAHIQQENTSGETQENSEIRQLVENLKRTDNFEKGIQMLYEAILQNPGINLGPYFKGCSKTFVDYVMAALERSNFQRNHPFANDGISTNQMKDIKYQLNPVSPMRHNPVSPMSQQKTIGYNFQRDTSNNSAVGGQGGSNLEEFHSKVNSLKMRYGLLLKKDNNNENQVQSTGLSPISALGGPMSSKVLSSANSNASAMTGGSESKAATSLGAGSSKTENILQKLSEMKLKMNSIVNASKPGNAAPNN